MSWLDPARFPRANAYNPRWVASAVSGGANPLLLTEWLTEVVDLRPGMRVLDLGCGRGVSSVFLRREFDVQVWSVDLWFSPEERLRRAEDAGIRDGLFPLRADARALPFARDFFDVVVSIDSFPYFGTDDLFLLDLARFLRPGGQLGIAGAGLTRELDAVPKHLAQWWEPATWCLHSAPWWRRHWERTGVLQVVEASTMPDGWLQWLAWQRLVAGNNTTEIMALEADQGAVLGYVRVAAVRTRHVVDDPITAIPTTYDPQPVRPEVPGESEPARPDVRQDVPERPVDDRPARVRWNRRRPVVEWPIARIASRSPSPGQMAAQSMPVGTSNPQVRTGATSTTIPA